MISFRREEKQCSNGSRMFSFIRECGIVKVLRIYVVRMSIGNLLTRKFQNLTAVSSSDYYLFIVIEA